MIGAHTDPAGVRRHVINAIVDRFSEVLVGEVVHTEPLGLPGRSVFATAVLELSSQFFLRGVHRYHRLTTSHVVGDLSGPIRELGVTVPMLEPSTTLALPCRLKAHLAQHPHALPDPPAQSIPVLGVMSRHVGRDLATTQSDSFGG